MKVAEGEQGLRPPMMGLMNPGSTEFQYWIPSDDGSYGWSEWISSGDPRMSQFVAALTCEECGELLYKREP